MKNSKFKLFFLGAVLLLSVSAAAVFYESNKEQTITLGIYSDSSWNVPNSEGTKVIDYAIKRFEKENRGVKIKYESGLEKNDYMDWLSEKIVSDKSPDVFIVPSKQFNMLASIGSMTKLNGYMKAEGIDKKIFYNGAYDAGSYSENQYALPYETNPMMMCINTELMKKEGIGLPGHHGLLKIYMIFVKRFQKISTMTESSISLGLQITRGRMRFLHMAQNCSEMTDQVPILPVQKFARL